MKTDQKALEIYQQAIKARSLAYAPYSNFLVGAAIKLKGSNTIISGSNVENMSYGGTVCAERVAVWKAVSEGHKNFESIVIVTQSEPAGSPCGMCLQVLSEFVDGEFDVYLANLNGVHKHFKFKELMPHPFDKKLL